MVLAQHIYSVVCARLYWRLLPAGGQEGIFKYIRALTCTARSNHVGLLVMGGPVRQGPGRTKAESVCKIAHAPGERVE